MCRLGREYPQYSPNAQLTLGLYRTDQNGLTNTWEKFMGFFDKVKDAAAKAASATTTAIGGAAGDLWTKYGDDVVRIIINFLEKVVNRNPGSIVDQAKYKEDVVDPCWALLPLPIQLIGRDRLQWDAIFLAARDLLFVIEGEIVSFHPDAKNRLSDLIASKMKSSES